MVYSYCKKHNPLFAYLPVESMIYKKQENYYAAINHSYYDGSSTEFIEFMLNTIKDVLSEAIEFQSDIQSDIQNVTLSVTMNFITVDDKLKSIPRVFVRILYIRIFT